MPEFNGKTDQILTIKLKSELLGAFWGSAAPAQGGTVPIEVSTRHVADGSEINVAIKDLEGNSLDSLKGKVHANTFRAPYTLSKPNKSGGMYFEVELPAHGLKAAGPRIKVDPPVQISQLKMLDDQGAELKKISRTGSLELTGKIAGVPDGTPCTFELFLDKGAPRPMPIHSAQGQAEGGKASHIWNFTTPSWEPRHLVQRDVAKEGSEYAPLRFLFELGCRGVRVKSEPVEYVSWVELDFGPIRGKAVLVMPDGAEATRDIPDDGILKVESPGAGRVLLKDILSR